jgi:hypothetical protein
MVIGVNLRAINAPRAAPITKIAECSFEARLHLDGSLRAPVWASWLPLALPLPQNLV